MKIFYRDIVKVKWTLLSERASQTGKCCKMLMTILIGIITSSRDFLVATWGESFWAQLSELHCIEGRPYWKKNPMNLHLFTLIYFQLFSNFFNSIQLLKITTLDLIYKIFAFKSYSNVKYIQLLLNW